MSDRTVRRLTLGLLACLGIYSLWRLDLTWSITYFLPKGDEAELVDLSLELIDSSLAHRMVLAVGGTPDRGRAAAELADSLRSDPEVACGRWAGRRGPAKPLPALLRTADLPGLGFARDRDPRDARRRRPRGAGRTPALAIRTPGLAAGRADRGSRSARALRPIPGAAPDRPAPGGRG